MPNPIRKDEIWQYFGQTVWAEWCGGRFDPENGKLGETHILFEVAIVGLLINDKPPLGTIGFTFSEYSGMTGAVEWKHYGTNMMCFKEKPEEPYFKSWIPLEEVKT
jgi:hypothetical protein